LTRVRSATYNLNYANNMTASRNALAVDADDARNNLATTYTYDSLRFAYAHPGGELAHLELRYDAVGNVRAITDTARSTG